MYARCHVLFQIAMCRSFDHLDEALKLTVEATRDGDFLEFLPLMHAYDDWKATQILGPQE